MFFFCEVFYIYNVFYRLRVCNEVYMGYSIEYYLGYLILTYRRFIEGGCIGCTVFNKVYIYTHVKYTGGIL